MSQLARLSRRIKETGKKGGWPERYEGGSRAEGG